MLRIPHQLRGLLVTLVLAVGPAPKLWEYSKDVYIENRVFMRSRDDVIDGALCIVNLKLKIYG